MGVKGEGFQEQVQRTHGQNQGAVGSDEGGGDGWGWGWVMGINVYNCTWKTIKQFLKTIKIIKEKKENMEK